MELNYRQRANGMYILSKNDIEKIATDVLKELSPENLEKPLPLKMEQLFEYFGLVVKYEYLGIPGYEILGATVMGDSAEIPTYNARFEPVVIEEDFGTVLINTTLCRAQNAPRRRFTEAHEISHWTLHRPYFDHMQQENRPNIVACRSVERNSLSRKGDGDWLEWQADTLAAALLMPRDIFFETVKRTIRHTGLLRDYLIKNRDRNVFYDIIQPICKQFFVSQRAAQIRMIQLGLIQAQ